MDGVGGVAALDVAARHVMDAVAVGGHGGAAAFVFAHGFATVCPQPAVVVQGGVQVAAQVLLAVMASAAVGTEVGDGRAGEGGFGGKDVAAEGDVHVAAPAAVGDGAVLQAGVIHVFGVGRGFACHRLFVPHAFCADAGFAYPA